MSTVYVTGDSLYHFGVLGMKWGVRRYQNKDGSLTEAGRKRYDKFNRIVEKKYNRVNKNIVDPQKGRWARANYKAERLSYEKGMDSEEFKKANAKAAKEFKNLQSMIYFANTMKSMEMQNIENGAYNRGKVLINSLTRDRGGLLSFSTIDYIAGETAFPISFGTSLNKKQLEELKSRYKDFKNAWESSGGD